MALALCGACGTAYAPDLAACPQCGATDHGWDWEEEMPKATVEGGPSDYAGGTQPVADEVPAEPVKPKTAARPKTTKTKTAEPATTE